MRQALNELEGEGLVLKVKGKGTYTLASLSTPASSSTPWASTRQCDAPATPWAPRSSPCRPSLAERAWPRSWRWAWRRTSHPLRSRPERRRHTCPGRTHGAAGPSLPRIGRHGHDRLLFVPGACRQLRCPARDGSPCDRRHRAEQRGRPLSASNRGPARATFYGRVRDPFQRRSFYSWSSYVATYRGHGFKFELDVMSPSTVAASRPSSGGAGPPTAR